MSAHLDNARDIHADLLSASSPRENGQSPLTTDLSKMTYGPPSELSVFHFAMFLHDAYPRLTPGMRTIGAGLLKIAIGMCEAQYLGRGESGTPPCEPEYCMPPW